MEHGSYSCRSRLLIQLRLQHNLTLLLRGLLHSLVRLQHCLLLHSLLWHCLLRMLLRHSWKRLLHGLLLPSHRLARLQHCLVRLLQSLLLQSLLQLLGGLRLLGGLTPLLLLCDLGRLPWGCIAL